mgnify:CR=1 FL=1
MKRKMFAIACVAIGMWSCSNDDVPATGNPEDDKVSAEVRAALLERYPHATDVKWTVKGDYVVADFNLSASSAAGEYAAWFDNGGRWYMTTDSEILFEQLPEEVKAAFRAGEYSAWTIDEVERVQRNGAEEVYVIEVKNKVDGVETEIDLYYSKDGVLVKKLVDADNDYDYGDYIPAAPVEGVEAFLKANFPNARILDIDREDNMTEVEILDGQVVRELLFDKASNWLFTKTETVYAALPAVVKQALEASEYAGYHVDDVDHYATPEEEYYRLELESVKGDVKVKITAAGVLSLMEYSPSDPGNNTGGVLPGKIKDFIAQKYAGARIIETDMENGMTEVEIFHDAREKDVYFNGAQEWVKTQWEVRVSELPAAVSDLNCLIQGGFDVRNTTEHVFLKKRDIGAEDLIAFLFLKKGQYAECSRPVAQKAALAGPGGEHLYAKGTLHTGKAQALVPHAAQKIAGVAELLHQPGQQIIITVVEHPGQFPQAIRHPHIARKIPARLPVLPHEPAFAEDGQDPVRGRCRKARHLNDFLRGHPAVTAEQNVKDVDGPIDLSLIHI